MDTQKGQKVGVWSHFHVELTHPDGAAPQKGTAAGGCLFVAGQGAEPCPSLLAWTYTQASLDRERLCPKKEKSSESPLPACYLLWAAQPEPPHGPDPPAHRASQALCFMQPKRHGAVSDRELWPAT